MPSPSELTKPSEINYDNLTFSEKNTLPIGASFVNVQYNGNPLYLQFPKLTAFGINKQYNEDESTEQKKFESTVRFEKMDEDSKVKECYEGLRTFEKHVKKWAKENSLDLFKKKKMSDEVIDTIFNDFFKARKDKDTGEESETEFYLRFKYPLDTKSNDGTFNVGVFNSKNKSMELTIDNIRSTILQYSTVKVVLTPNIYISSGKFGVTWKVWQLKYWEPERQNAILDKKTYCMVDSSDDEEEEESDVPEEENKNDDDDDDDSD